MCALSKYFTYIPLYESVYQGCELHIVAMAAFTVALKSLLFAAGTSCYLGSAAAECG